MNFLPRRPHTSARRRVFPPIHQDNCGRPRAALGVSQRHFLSASSLIRLCLPRSATCLSVHSSSCPPSSSSEEAALPDLFVSRVAVEVFILILLFVRPDSSLGGGVLGWGGATRMPLGAAFPPCVLSNQSGDTKQVTTPLTLAL